MANRYAFLSFQPGVDWRDVNPSLLTRLNRLAMKLGETITVTSGFRSIAQQKYLWDHAKELGLVRGITVAQPGRSEHNKGLALDATVNGKPIGNVVSERQMRQFGIAWLQGDPVHVHLFGKGPAQEVKQGASVETPQAPQTSSLPSAVTDSGPVPGGPPNPDETLPPILSPGSVPAEASPQHTAELWRLIAAQPLSSPETQQFAQRAASAGG